MQHILEAVNRLSRPFDKKSGCARVVKRLFAQSIPYIMDMEGRFQSNALRMSSIYGNYCKLLRVQNLRIAVLREKVKERERERECETAIS